MRPDAEVKLPSGTIIKARPKLGLGGDRSALGLELPAAGLVADLFYGKFCFFRQALAGPRCLPTRCRSEPSTVV